jgi:signal-transduction protein with cAMP-binding, CBS, and nucleotidyltransferase domain
VTGRLDAGALAELFLFEKLTTEQLTWLAERGEVAGYEAGTTVYRAGEPAT